MLRLTYTPRSSTNFDKLKGPLQPDTVFGLTFNAEARVGTVVRGDAGGMSTTYVTPFLVAAGGF